MLTLFDCATAPSPRRARIFLREKGIEYCVVQVDLRAGEHLCEAFRKVNPHCTVPALRIPDGTVLTDNASISAFLEAAKPEPPLLGRTANEKAEIASWIWRIEFEGLLPISDAIRNRSPKLKNRAVVGPRNHQQIPDLVARSMLRVQDFFDLLNDHAAHRQFLAAEMFSAADIAAVVAVDVARAIGIAAEDRHVNLRRWHAEMVSRPSMAM